MSTLYADYYNRICYLINYDDLSKLVKGKTTISLQTDFCYKKINIYTKILRNNIYQT